MPRTASRTHRSRSELARITERKARAKKNDALYELRRALAYIPDDLYRSFVEVKDRDPLVRSSQLAHWQVLDVATKALK